MHRTDIIIGAIDCAESWLAESDEHQAGVMGYPFQTRLESSRVIGYHK